MKPKAKKHYLSVFSLVMINVIAVDSLRTLPMSAILGLSLVFYYLVAAVMFFIPVALISAELATTYPHTGGLYVWVREAFGLRAGFITIWLLWIYNVVWYPTILAFIVATSAYLFSPSLTNNASFILFSSITLFWIFTILNAFGMRLSSLISTIGAIFGTILPMLFIIILGVTWLLMGNPAAIDLHQSIIPKFNSLEQFALLPGILFGLLGMEMSAVHAEEVKNPQKDYPKALLYSTIIIFATLMFSSLAITFVVAPEKLSIVSGLIDAFDLFFTHFNIPWLTKILALLIILGAIAGVAAWIIGPTKGLLAAAKDGSLPQRLAKVNRHGAPVPILIIQGIVFTILCFVFQLFDTVNAAYWLLSDLSAQMALMVYVMMFASAIKLRFKHKNKPRPFRIPGNNLVLILVASCGLLSCFTAILIGFIPPAQIPISHIWRFEAFLGGGLMLFIFLPLICMRFNSKV
ncbi:MAG: transporter [Legionellales bacterium RIFCSPHIGHO2_12_FULL_37_14]|nr:MAG: transporter [Legionellales bacterium RIFCSPHIGHO2_12_FULL_37_14]